MGFDVVVIEAIDDEAYAATGIVNGDDPEYFTGVGHTLSENLRIACSNASDHKAWLTSTAFDQLSDIRDEVYNKCYGVVTDNGFTKCEKVYRHHYACYFDESSIIMRFNVQSDINVHAPDSAHEDDEVVINVTVTNTGVIPADMCTELYDGSTRIGACAGTNLLKPGECATTQYIRTMPNHDWHLTAKVVSNPPVDVTKDFTIALGGTPSNGGINDNTPHDGVDHGKPDEGGNNEATNITCDGMCPKFDGTGCALLNHYDVDNDGIISYEELLSARSDGLDGTITPEETEFVLAAYNAGSINALCPGCYTSSTTTPITPTPSEGNKNMTYIIIAIVIALLALLLRR